MRNREIALRATLLIIAVVQLFFGLTFLVAPEPFADLVGLPAAPGWADWLFAMMGARFIGYAVGLYIASRDPARYLAWIWTMAGIQAIDWISTLAHLGMGDVHFGQAPTAVILPPLFVVALLLLAPRARAASVQSHHDNKQAQAEAQR